MSGKEMEIEQVKKLSLKEYMSRIETQYGTDTQFLIDYYHLMAEVTKKDSKDDEILKLKSYLLDYERRLRQMEDIVNLSKQILKMDLKEHNNG